MAVGEDEIVNNQISDTRVHGNAGVRLETIVEPNPYLEDLVVQCSKRDGGYEYVGGKYEKKYFLSERDEKTSLYLSLENRNKILGLGASGMRLFVWIVYTVKRSHDKYWLNTKQFMRESGVSINTMKAGIKELLDKDIVRTTKAKYTYFLNPSLFYRGNRILDFEEYVEVNDSRIKIEQKDYGRINKSNEDFKQDIDNIF